MRPPVPNSGSRNSRFLLAANPGSSLFDAGDTVPDTDGSDAFTGAVLDTGSGLPEGGTGLLDRLTISIAPNTGDGLYPLNLEPNSSVHLDTSGAAYVPLTVNNATRAVGTPCP
jgi:hypothetical protein